MTPQDEKLIKEFKPKYLRIKKGNDKLDLLLSECMNCNVVLSWDEDNHFECPLCKQKYIASPKVLRINEI